MSQVPGCDAQNPSLQGANTWQRRPGSHMQAESGNRQGQRLLEETHFIPHLFHKPEWRRRSGKPGPALSSGRHPGEGGTQTSHKQTEDKSPGAVKKKKSEEERVRKYRGSGRWRGAVEATRTLADAVLSSGREIAAELPEPRNSRSPDICPLPCTLASF